MPASSRRERVTAWLNDPIARLLVLLGLALVLAVSSILSFMFLGATGAPTRFELALLALAVVITFYVGITAGGT